MSRTASQIGKHSKGKGAAYERYMCGRLSLWVTGLLREDVYWRSAMSGGRATLGSGRVTRPGHKNRGLVPRLPDGRRLRIKDARLWQGQAGDITATHPAGHLLLSIFLIECKHYQRHAFGIESLVYGKDTKTRYHGFWATLCDDCERYHREPMLILKQDRLREIVLLSPRGFDILAVAAQKPLLPTATYPRSGMVAVPLEDILAIPFERFRKGAR